MKKSLPQLSLPVSFRLALLAGFLPMALHGQLRWDTTTGDIIVTEGTGTWEVGSGNFWDGAADQVWTDGNAAIFGGGTAGSADTVTLGSNVSPSTLRFEAPADGDYTLDLASFDLNLAATTQNLTMNGNAIVTIDSSGGGLLFLNGTNATNSLTGTLTINAQVSETLLGSRFFITGANTVTFTNPLNDFTGIFGKQNGGGGLIFDSIADIGIPSAAGAGSEVQVNINGRVVYNGNGHSTNRTLRVLGGGSGRFSNNGLGPIVWTGANSFSNASTNNKIFTLGGTNTGENEIQGIIADNGANVFSIDKINAGTWILSGDNTYTGATTIRDGILQANANEVAATSGPLGNGGIINFDGGTLQYSALSASTDYASRFGDSTQAISLDTNGQDVTLTAFIADTNIGGLNKDGAGTLTLVGDNLYTGTTTISDGVLVADASDALDITDPLLPITTSGALGAGGNISFEGGTLQYTANSAATDYSARIANSSSAMVFDTNGQDVTLVTDLASSNTEGLTKFGEGQLTVAWDGAYTGTTKVDEGTLVLTNDTTNANSTSADFQINNSSTLVIEGSAQPLVSDRTFTFDSMGGGTLDLDRTALWRENTIVTTGGSQNTFSGTSNLNMQNTRETTYTVADGIDAVDLVVSVRHDRGSLTKNGDGTLSLTNNANNFRNDATSINTITITGGTLELSEDGQLRTQGNGAANWTGEIINNGTYKHNSTAEQTLSGIISGTGSLEKDNNSTLFLTGVNTYTGDTIVNEGILELGDGTNNTNLADTSTVTIGSVAVLNLNYSGTDTISGLIIDGVPQTDGVYDSTHPSGAITGPGTLTVVSGVATSIFDAWALANGLTAANNNTAANPDNDGLVNLLEFAFGTDPLANDGGALLLDGSVNGAPIIEVSGSGAAATFEAVFVRRDDHGTSGSLNYIVQFSGDLDDFEDDITPPTFVIDSSDDSDYEVVSLPFPALLANGQQPRFFRVRVELAP